MASEANDIKNEPQPKDEAADWYNSRRADTLRQVDGQLNELASGYSALENAWSQLDYRENEGHDSLDTRILQSVWNERQQLQQQAAQISNAYATLQNERQRLEQHSDPSFDDLLNGSSQKAQLFLTAHRRELQDNPAALKRLLRADALYKASLGKPDTNQYFEILKTAADLGEPNADDFSESSDEMRASSNATRRESSAKVKATEAQRVMARNLPGISEDEYLKACSQPFSNAAQTVSLEPDDLNLGNNSKGMSVSFDEAPKQAPVKYRPPSPKSSVNLSPAELSLIEHMATQTGQSLQEAKTEFARQKLALHSGKTSHMLYEDRLKAMGQA